MASVCNLYAIRVKRNNGMVKLERQLLFFFFIILNKGQANNEHSTRFYWMYLKL